MVKNLEVGSCWHWFTGSPTPCNSLSFSFTKKLQPPWIQSKQEEDSRYYTSLVVPLSQKHKSFFRTSLPYDRFCFCLTGQNSVTWPL